MEPSRCAAARRAADAGRLFRAGEGTLDGCLQALDSLAAEDMWGDANALCCAVLSSDEVHSLPHSLLCWISARLLPDRCNALVVSRLAMYGSRAQAEVLRHAAGLARNRRVMGSLLAGEGAWLPCRGWAFGALLPRLAEAQKSRGRMDQSREEAGREAPTEGATVRNVSDSARGDSDADSDGQYGD